MATTQPGEAFSNDDGAIADFCAVTSASAEQAKFYLEASNGRFDSAVSMYFDQGGGREPNAEPFAPVNGISAGRERLERGYRRHERLLGLLFNIPRTVLQTGFGLLFGTFRFTASLVGLVGANVLPAPILHSVQGRLRRLGPVGPASPRAAASEFARSFGDVYGATRPRWLDTSWAEAARRAHREFKFLLVYLHSPSHQDTESFCRGTLCSEELVEYVNTNFACWGGDITKPDAFQECKIRYIGRSDGELLSRRTVPYAIWQAYLHSIEKLSQSLRVSAYPYIGLLAYSGSRTRLIAGAEGYFAPDSLLPVLRAAQEEQAAQLVVEQAEQSERDFNRRLREEQDVEYQRSLEADRERERQQRAAEAAEADARRASENAAAHARAAEQAESQRRATTQGKIDARRANKRSSLGAEPLPDSGDTVQVRVRLPDGSNHQRRFLANEAVQRAFDFVDSLEFLKVLEYSLVSSYPRRIMTQSSVSNSTFAELGLTPQAMLFVQPGDE